MASGGTGGTFVLEHGAGAVEKKPSGAGFGWFNALTDSFVGNALKPIFTRCDWPTDRAIGRRHRSASQATLAM